MKIIAIALAALIGLTGCAAEQEKVVRLATHDSFYITDEQIAEFTEQTGYELEIIKMGDTGSLTNQLVLSKNAPIADAFYGIDNTFLSVAEGNKLSENYVSIDYADVCFNYDMAWFKNNKVNPPVSWRELGDNRFKDLVVVTNPMLSSPGMAFLATTFAGFSTNAEVFAYWRSLRDNGVKVAPDWSAAYFSEFTKHGGKRPIVLSYASSPAAEISDAGEATTAALRDECFRQIEYAGVLNKAKNAPGAKAVVEYLQSAGFQAGLPWNMFVYPTASVELPAEWVKHAAPARTTLGSELDFAANRERWIKDWSDVFDN
jgi:thiamine transport system substrate-binding protein